MEPITLGGNFTPPLYIQEKAITKRLLDGVTDFLSKEEGNPCVGVVEELKKEPLNLYRCTVLRNIIFEHPYMRIKEGVFTESTEIKDRSYTKIIPKKLTDSIVREQFSESTLDIMRTESKEKEITIKYFEISTEAVIALNNMIRSFQPDVNKKGIPLGPQELVLNINADSSLESNLTEEDALLNRKKRKICPACLIM